MNLEPGIVGTLLECDLNGETPNLARLLDHAPESCDDLRAGETLVVIHQLRAEGKTVHQAAVVERLKFPDALSFISGCQLDALTLPIAELEAETLWKKYVSRQTAKLLAEIPGDLIADPENGHKHRVRLIAELQRLDADGNSLSERLKVRLHRADHPVPRPDSVYSINGVSICTAGNITTISGQAKSGKTALVQGLIASTFAAPGADCLGCGSSNPKNYAVIHIDTEQSLFDFDQISITASRRAQRPEPEWLVSYGLKGFSADDIRLAIPMLLEQNKRRFGGIHSIILDGGADALHDPNDAGESNSLVAEHDALAIKYACPFIVNIHENPSETNRKMRGHYGSQCERKAESNLKVEKDENEVCTAWASKNRHAPLLKKNGPRFKWDGEQAMHISVESQADAKEDVEYIELSKVFQSAFESRPCMSFSDLRATIKKALMVSEPTVERKMKRAITLEIIRKTIGGLYELRT